MAKVPGVGWLTTTKGPEELGLAFPGPPAENLLKIVGPDLDELDRLAASVEAALRFVPGIENIAAYRSLGQAHLEFRIDAEKCQKWGLPTADVAAVVQTALGVKALSQMVEGEKAFDITVRWPQRLRDGETTILDLPIDGTNSKVDVGDPIKVQPRLRLRDLVSPVGKDGTAGPEGGIHATRSRGNLSRAREARVAGAVQCARPCIGRRSGRRDQADCTAAESPVSDRMGRLNRDAKSGLTQSLCSVPRLVRLQAWDCEFVLPGLRRLDPGHTV